MATAIQTSPTGYALCGIGAALYVPSAFVGLFIAEQDTYLRAEVDVELQSVGFFAECEVGEEWYLQVVETAAVAVAGLVVEVLFPSTLGIIDL